MKLKNTLIVFRGKGIGKAMFLHCVKLAKERNCGRMEWTVLDWNPARSSTNTLGLGLLTAGTFTGWVRKNSKMRLKNKLERVDLLSSPPL
ncbi:MULTISPECIES: GNAT family N-acetyltransferase [unclassified Methanosarcina]|uniref:GNAT family N-acetyltransferase n=2 Tax=Methanosarcina TaxID=2207 RepID=UPI001F442DF0|nr:MULTISPECIES: GNAT family N-acetyltransferase [unclassified Methanosarcina]